MNVTERWVTAGAALLAVAAAARGQIPVDHGNEPQVNPSLQASGFYDRIPVFGYRPANRFAGGGVPTGPGYVGPSTIYDPTSAHLWSSLDLPSPDGRFVHSTSGPRLGTPGDAIQGLWVEQLPDASGRRVGLGGYEGYGPGYGPQPYSWPWSRPAAIGLTAGGIRPGGSSLLLSPYASRQSELRQPIGPAPADSSQETGWLPGIPTRLIRADTGEPVSGPVNLRLLSSPLFGGVQQMPVEAAAPQRQSDTLPGGRTGALLDLPGVALRPPDTRADRPAAQSKLIEPLGSPLDRVLAGPIGGSQGIGREMADSLPRPGHRGAAAPADRGSAGAEDTSSLGPAGMGVSSLAEAGDVFAGMRRVSGRLRAPLGVSRGAGTEVEAGPAATARRQAALRRPLGPKTGIPSGLPEAGPTRATPEPQPSPAAELAAQPLKTFVGTEESVMNRYLADAEAMLKSGQYYKAASAYDFARAVDLRNPLPLVGRSMALLAAGDYMTSVTNLFQAIKLYESLADFAIDMRKFIPDMAVLDRRRADLERLLERFEDFRLRFLLGYAEYCSGLEEIGLSDLEKAAQAAPREMSFVPRFVEALKRRTVGPSKPIGVSP